MKKYVLKILPIDEVALPVTADSQRTVKAFQTGRNHLDRTGY